MFTRNFIHDSHQLDFHFNEKATDVYNKRGKTLWKQKFFCSMPSFGNNIVFLVRYRPSRPSICRRFELLFPYHLRFKVYQRWQQECNRGSTLRSSYSPDPSFLSTFSPHPLGRVWDPNCYIHRTTTKDEWESDATGNWVHWFTGCQLGITKSTWDFWINH